MTSITFTNPFDAITDDKELAILLKMQAKLLIVLRDILDQKILIQATNENPDLPFQFIKDTLLALEECKLMAK